MSESEQIKVRKFGFVEDTALQAIRCETGEVIVISAYMHRHPSREEALRHIELVQEYLATFSDDDILHLNWRDCSDPNCEICRERKREDIISNRFAIRRGKVNVKGFCYLAKWNDVYKIGASTNVANRIESLKSKHPGIRLVAQIPSNSCFDEELKWLRRFALEHTEGEFFNLTDADVAEFCEAAVMAQ